MPPFFCTLSIGRPYWRYAKYLADDLADFGYKLLVVTDGPAFFEGCKNVIVKEFHPPAFHHNLKCHAYKAALPFSESIMWIDADSALSESVPVEVIRRTLAAEFPPGLHTWKAFTREEYPYPQIEALAAEFKLPFDPSNITYQERISGLRLGGRDAEFLDLWDKFGEEIFKRFGYMVGDGTAMAICAQATGIVCHGDRYLGPTALAEIFVPIRHRYPLGFNLRPLRKLRARSRGWPSRPKEFVA